MLTFIGLGLFDEKDISIKGYEAIKNADIVFAEFYTAFLSGTTKENLEKFYNKKIVELSREEVENGEIILKNAKEKNVVLICAGDSMMATTHVDLRIRAEEKGIKTKVIFGVAISTAVPSLLGLQHYKFGRTTTIPFPEKNYFPESPYDVIKNNLRNELHTLVLLDIQKEKNLFMTVNQGIEYLLKIEEKKKENIFTSEAMICGVARVGSDNFVVKCGKAKELLKENFGKPLHCIVVPSKLHFMEKLSLERFSIDAIEK